MRKVEQWFQHYGESHTNKINKKIHWFAIPLIIFSLLGMLQSLETSLFGLNLMMILIIGAHFYYLILSWKLTIGMLIFTSICVFLISNFESTTNLPLGKSSIAIFIFAWIAQFIGHKIEGKKPSFLEDIQFLLIGPLWLLGFIYQKLSIKY